MDRYKLTVLAEMTFELDAINPEAAESAIRTAFHHNSPGDPLAHTWFKFNRNWVRAADPVLETTVYVESVVAAQKVA